MYSTTHKSVPGAHRFCWARDIVKRSICCIYYTVCVSVRPLRWWVTPKWFKISNMLCTIPQNDVCSLLKPTFAILNLRIHRERLRSREASPCEPRKFDLRYLGNGIHYYYLLIKSRIRTFDWYRNRWPWMILAVTDVMAVILRYLIEFGGFGSELETTSE